MLKSPEQKLVEKPPINRVFPKHVFRVNGKHLNIIFGMVFFLIF